MSSYFTPIFIMVFFTVTVIAYALMPRRARWAVLLIASYAFVYIISKSLIVFLIVTTVSVYAIARGMKALFKRRDEQLAQAKAAKRGEGVPAADSQPAQATEGNGNQAATDGQPAQATEEASSKGSADSNTHPAPQPLSKREIKDACTKRAKLLLVVGILLNFGILVALKYLGFFGEVASSALQLFGVDVTLTVPKIGITIGISFYTLMAVSYLVDVYRETVVADDNPLRVALFLSFFPQIMEGPICRYEQTATALWAGSPLTCENFYAGTLRMVVGFAKKFIVADRLDLFVTPVFRDYANYDGGIIALGAILYTIQLYFDFSGCMDMALGMGRIFGVTLPENFRQPLLSKTASEFWQRWHITLGTWFKDYIYYPVSLSSPIRNLTKRARKTFGNRYGPLLTGSIALFCVWFCNGLWHGAGSQYLFFGMYYFVLILAGGLIEPQASALAAKLHINRECLPYRIFRIVRTLIVIFVGELFFRANGLPAGIAMFGQMVGNFTLDSIVSGAMFKIGLSQADLLAASVFALLVFASSIAREHGHNILEIVAEKRFVIRWGFWLLLFFAIVVFGAYGVGYVPIDPMYAQF